MTATRVSLLNLGIVTVLLSALGIQGFTKRVQS